MSTDAFLSAADQEAKLGLGQVGFPTPYVAYLTVLTLVGDALCDCIEHGVSEPSRYQTIRDAMSAAMHLRTLAEAGLPRCEPVEEVRHAILSRTWTADEIALLRWAVDSLLPI